MGGHNTANYGLKDVLNERSNVPCQIRASFFAHLRASVPQVVLHVLVLHVLRKNNMIQLSAPTNNIGLNVNLPRGRDFDVDVAIAADNPSGGREGERIHLVRCDATSCPFRGGVGNHLHETRYIPILIDRVVRLRRDDVECNCVRSSISQQGNKRRKVQEVSGKIKSSVCRNRPGKCLSIVVLGRCKTLHTSRQME